MEKHPFYEDYSAHMNHSGKSSAYFGVLLHEQQQWLDSHQLGIDGSLMHFDTDAPMKLHVGFLSFERHALVGDYVMDLR